MIVHKRIGLKLRRFSLDSNCLDNKLEFVFQGASHCSAQFALAASAARKAHKRRRRRRRYAFLVADDSRSRHSAVHNRRLATERVALRRVQLCAKLHGKHLYARGMCARNETS